MNAAENIVNLINVSENDEKSLIDFESLVLVMQTPKLMSPLTSLTFKRINLLPLTEQFLNCKRKSLFFNLAQESGL